jgi:methyl-accepting chemotaxis protein
MFFTKNKDKEILEMLDGIEEYLKNDINSLPEFNFECSGTQKKMKNKLDSICNILNQRNDEELQIYGELMLVAEKVQAGNFNDKIHHTNTSNSKLNYIANTINLLVDNLKSSINEILEMLDSYSNYNYIKQLDENLVENDFKILFVDINNLRKTITEMLVENKSNGLTLDESSDVLLENVDKLNRSSNAAAASLEETAAALEEITLTIRDNTENVAKMATFSTNVTTSALNGENLASDTTIAMDEINTQVNLINEAISVIDQIAFQTNILSLNAAVEAATAGEAGRGFAVVAGEVRNLASRSADAAKEIKAIVGTATKKANEGKEIASNMIEGYKDLNVNIQQTINLIEEIKLSSREQQNKIEQINKAINSLDTQTQQNAQVASQSYDVAVVIDKIAKLIVNNADEKEFEGKNEVQSKRDYH